MTVSGTFRRAAPASVFLRILHLTAGLAVLMVLAPIAVILLSWAVETPSLLQHLPSIRLPEILSNTLVLILGVGTLVTLLGVSLAWLTATCEFPGRRYLDWALVLPMAMPPYVLAFAFLGLFDIGGTVQNALAAFFGPGMVQLNLRNPASVVLVFSLALYPYVYLLVRSAFLMQGVELLEAARALGRRPAAAFLGTVLPAARPALAAGLALVMMETLADFGVVSVFNYNTFTTAIYRTWMGLYDLAAAAQLASLLLLVSLLVPWLERLARSRARYTSTAVAPRRRPLLGFRGWLAACYALLVLTLGFLLPLIQLGVWAWPSLSDLGERYGGLVFHSLVLAGITTLATLLLALLLALLRHRRPTPLVQLTVSLASTGYALPGTVLAVGLVLALGWLLQVLPEDAPWVRFLLPGSFGILVVAYMARFLAVALAPLESGLVRVRPVLTEAAQNLGASRPRILRRIYLPLLTPAAGTAFALVFVEVMREMPATLLLRPFGWDTLAVRIFEMTSEGEWQRAAVPALVLVLVSLVPMALALGSTVSGAGGRAFRFPVLRWEAFRFSSMRLRGGSRLLE